MRKLCCVSGLVCIVSLFLLSSRASAFQMTFDVQGFVQNQIVGPTIEEDNIHLTSSSQYYASASFHGNPGFGMLPTSAPRVITVTLIGGADFDFGSIDFNESNSAIPPQQIVFTGTKAGGGTVIDTVTSDGTIDNYETMVPSGDFTDLTQINIKIQFGAFDNIVLAPALEIPTVSQWGLFAIALLLFATGTLLIIRRSRAKAA